MKYIVAANVLCGLMFLSWVVLHTISGDYERAMCYLVAFVWLLSATSNSIIDADHNGRSLFELSIDNIEVKLKNLSLQNHLGKAEFELKECQKELQKIVDKGNK